MNQRISKISLNFNFFFTPTGLAQNAPSLSDFARANKNFMKRFRNIPKENRRESLPGIKRNLSRNDLFWLFKTTSKHQSWGETRLSFRHLACTFYVLSSFYDHLWVFSHPSCTSCWRCFEAKVTFSCLLCGNGLMIGTTTN